MSFIIFSMSIIIELQHHSTNNSQPLNALLTAVFNDPQFHCYKSIVGKSTVFFLKPAYQTYRLSTQWLITTRDQHLTISVRFLFHQLYLKASTERTKLECSIMLRILEKMLHPNHKIYIQIGTGAIRNQLTLNKSEFLNNYPSERLKACIKYLLNSFWKTDYVQLFLEGGTSHKQLPKEEKAITKIGRYREFLKDTQMRRECLKHSIVQNFVAPNNLTNAVFCDISKFHQNQILMEKNEENTHVVGLREGSFSEANQKIVNGLKNIKFDKKKKKLLSEDGAHSLIYLVHLQYTVVDTIDIRTINYSKQQWERNARKITGDLIYKECNNFDRETTVNSFNNELRVLNYLKDDMCPYIAKYYLEAKETWDEKDKIYMKMYKTDLQKLFNEHRSSLRMLTCLRIGYQIARSLCFLSTKQLLHRDLKTENVVVDHSLMVHLIDFGSACPVHNSTKFKVQDQRLITTPLCHVRWNKLVSPHKQVITSKFTVDSYNKHPLFDVMGLGRILCFMFFNSIDLPPPEKLEDDCLNTILQNIYYLVSLCLKVDPDDRPGVTEIASYLSALIELVPEHMLRDYHIDQL